MTAAPCSRRRLLQRAASLGFGPAIAWPGLATAISAPAAAARSRVRPGDAAWPADASGSSSARSRRCAGRGPFATRGLRPCRRRRPARSSSSRLQNPVLPRRRRRASPRPSAGSTPGPRSPASTRSRRATPPTSPRRSTSRASTGCAWWSRAAATATRAPRTRADSLLVWTRPMNDIALHDAFVAAGLRRPRRSRCARSPSAPARSGPQAYDAVTTQGGALRAGRRLHDGGRRRPGPERRLRQLLEGLRHRPPAACSRPRS